MSKTYKPRCNQFPSATGHQNLQKKDCVAIRASSSTRMASMVAGPDVAPQVLASIADDDLACSHHRRLPFSLGEACSELQARASISRFDFPAWQMMANLTETSQTLHAFSSACKCPGVELLLPVSAPPQPPFALRSGANAAVACRLQPAMH